MPRAEVHYYPAGLGHIGVNIIFSKDELPDQKDYQILIYTKDNPLTHFEEKCKLHARTRFCPAIFLQDDGKYTIYGYKDGSWQETPLTELSSEEQLLLHELPFSAVLIKENNKFAKASYQNGVWQKESLPEGRYPAEDWESQQITPGPLFNLVQKGHPEFKRTEYFYDWGGAYDFQENLTKRGKSIRIPLPPTSKNLEEFFDEIEKKDYQYCSPHDSMSYRLFTNNCAHATLGVLHAAGYTSKMPKASFGLTPFIVARKACDLAHKSRALFRKQLLESVLKTDPIQLVNTLIELNINRLNDNIHFNYGKQLEGCSKELEKLAEIKYDGSYESIERLLKVSEEASPHTAKELEECIALVNPEACLTAGIARLESAAETLKNKKNAHLIQIAASDLRQELADFKEEKTSHEHFISRCSHLMDEVSPVLKNERSISKQILKNIALAACGFVVLYLIAGFINKSNTGNFLFFNEPCLSKISTDIQDNASRLSDDLKNESPH